jgi:DNA-binding NtrC family response regulator
VLAVSLGEAFVDRSAAGASAVTALRLMDVIAWAGATQLLVLLPELAGEAARSAGLHMIEALAPLAASVKGGLACYPADGSDADTLISVARTAVDVAQPGAVGAAADAVVRHAIGDRSIVVADPAMIHLFNLIRRLAARDMPILVLGETGTGKESAASALHYWSPRAGKPFVSLNCATLPESLVESELFGYEKGAFSDAKAPKPGLLEEANGGTLFLDEVGELPDKVQAKLLRVLETRRITRLGAVREREIDVRIVAATNRDLAAESQAGRFRSDLYFRLNAGCVNLPPLRLRPREIVTLARMFLADERARFGQPPADLSEASLRIITAYGWPGNVRELKNAMAWAATMAAEGPVEPWDLPASIGDRGQEPAEQKGAEEPPPPASARAPSSRARSLAEELRRLEIARMEEALDAAGGVQVRAAAILGMPLRTFAYKQKQFGIALKGTRRRT